jgi:hypothetical protein
MKKKFREITVDGVKYGWTVYFNEEGPNIVTIWLNKKPLYASLSSGYEEITPKLIRYWILTKGEKTITQLLRELNELRKENLEVWKVYGSELCAGDMFAKEKNLEVKIEMLKELVK